MIKLVWPFTSNAGRENGKKKYISGNRCQYDHKGDQKTMGRCDKKLKIKNWISCIQDNNKWKSYAEKAKTFKD
jgi:hypothetical protein